MRCPHLNFRTCYHQQPINQRNVCKTYIKLQYNTIAMTSIDHGNALYNEVTKLIIIMLIYKQIYTK